MELESFAYIPYLLTIAAFLGVTLAGYTRRFPFTSVPIIALVALTALVYVVPAVLMSDVSNPDIANFRYTGGLVRDNTFVYSAPSPVSPLRFHPYLPFQMFIAAAADWSSDVLGVPFSVGLKLPSIAAALATAILLRAAASRLWGEQAGTILALGYLLNPILVGMTAYHGQFDAIPAFFAFAAWFKLRFARGPGDELMSASLLGLGVLSKSWPLILLPIFAVLLRSDLWGRLRYVAIVVAIPAAISLAYAVTLGGSVERMVRQVADYSGISGFYGWSFILAHLPGSEQEIVDRLAWARSNGRYILWPPLLAIMAIELLRQRAASAAAMTLILAFYVFTPAGAFHYYMWILPFAAIAGHGAFLFFLTGMVAVDICGVNCWGHDWGFPAPYVDHAWFVGASVWAFSALWLAWSLFELRRHPPPLVASS